ncbi:MAG: DUF3341 domain-containing protein [Verrucomicrobia bacterium]|nr:DUF3341 domain-containing protein [Verrucomicrobiota bacterium]
MSKKFVICIAPSEAQASGIVDCLREECFSNNDISILLPDKADSRDFANEKETKAPEGAATGAGAGALLGGAFGWLVGIGALAIPGVGSFVAAGPIVAAVSGAAVGGAVCGIAGALIGLGIPEYEAMRYEGKVKRGGILISVHTEDLDEVRTAKEVFELAGATDISTTGEPSFGSSSKKEKSGRYASR